jgi:hypothetical protein
MWWFGRCAGQTPVSAARVAGRALPTVSAGPSQRRRLVRASPRPPSSGSWSAVAVSGGDATFAEFGQHGGVVDAQVVTYSIERPAEVVEMDGLVDLQGGGSTAAHRHAASVENVADCASIDAEPCTQLVHRRSGLVAGDEFLDLLGVELACPSRFGPIYGGWSRCGRVGQLPEEGFQGFYLGFCVVVSSPKVHRGTTIGTPCTGVELRL